MIMTAKQVLDKYWDSTAPVDPVAIANKVGIKVYTSSNMPKELSGVIQKDKQSNQLRIIVNGSLNEHQRRFTMAYELGHYFNTEEFDGQIDDSTDILIYNRDNNSSQRKFEVFKFAVELLMPKEAVYYFLFKKKYFTIKQLVEVFNVSEMAIVNRLKNLGIIKGL